MNLYPYGIKSQALGGTLGEPGDYVDFYDRGQVAVPANAYGFNTHYEWSCSGGGDSGPTCEQYLVTDYPTIQSLDAIPFPTKAQYQAQVKDPTKYLPWSTYYGLWRALLSVPVDQRATGWGTWAVTGRHIGYWGSRITDPDVPKPGLWDFVEPGGGGGPFSNANPENGYSLMMLSDTIPGGWALGFNAYTGAFTGMVSVHGSPGGFFRNLVSDLGPILPALLAITGAGALVGESILGAAGVAASETVTAAVGNVAIQTALNGGDVGKAAVATAVGLVSNGAGQLVGESAGSAVVANVAQAATQATLTGGDIKQAVGMALVQSGGQALVSQPAVEYQPIDQGTASPDTTGTNLTTTQGGTMDEVTSFYGSTDAQQLVNAGTVDVPQSWDGLVTDTGGGWEDWSVVPPPIDHTQPNTVDFPPEAHAAVETGWTTVDAGGNIITYDANGNVTDIIPPAPGAAEVDTPQTTADGTKAVGEDGSSVDLKTGQATGPDGKPANGDGASWADAMVVFGQVYQMVTGKPLASTLPKSGKTATGRPVSVFQDGTRVVNNGNGTFTTYKATGGAVTTDKKGKVLTLTASKPSAQGGQVLTYSDGSTLTTDQAGNVVASTPAGLLGGGSTALYLGLAAVAFLVMKG